MKSTIIYDIIARITRSDFMPPVGEVPLRRAHKGSVLIFSQEDEADSVIRPRIEAAGGDIRKVHFVKRLPDRPANESDLEELTYLNSVKLEPELRRLEDCRLVLIDPLADFTGPFN